MIASPSARRSVPRAAFVAALEYVMLDAYDATATAGARATAGHAEQADSRPSDPRTRTRVLPSDRPAGATFFTAGRLGEIVALCSVAAVLAGTAARAGSPAPAISTPTLAAATDTATPVGAVATPAVSNWP